MFLRRQIPVVSSVSLLLGGGCGDGGATPGDIAKQTCDAFRQCDTEYFTENYESYDDCIRSTRERIESYAETYEEMYGEECIDASIRYAECFYEEYLRECNEYMAEEACADLKEEEESLCSE